MSSEKSRNRWFAVGALSIALVAFLVLTIGGIGENLVYYWGPEDIAKAGEQAVGATIRLGGQVESGSIDWDPEATDLRFNVVDGVSAYRVPVRTTGIPPQMFREEIGVVVEGTMTSDGWFRGTRLLVSHDNEYKVPEEGEPVDPRKMMDTTEGLPAEARAKTP
ncbi:MAG: cytochrome c maturation protein CcmE [Thermoanaerobaculia bacterium]|nr:cytochrome c maturation protein CcmE [Thermoanaerobaculia bacterium]